MLNLGKAVPQVQELKFKIKNIKKVFLKNHMACDWNRKVR